MVKKWSVNYHAVNGWEQRSVYLYLPVMYDDDPEQRFPVLYMFDGQNVFWDEEATFGKSWGMERFLDENNVPIIVAALACNAGADNERLKEYSPYPFDDEQYGHFDGVGDTTLRWYSRSFKSFVDRNFRTLPSREFTFIAGSSMGGLMSLYALLRYNRVYSRAAALSPSIWVAPNRLVTLTRRARLSPGNVLYMDYGSREMANHDGIRRDFARLGSELVNRDIYLTERIVPGGTHSEASWESQLPFVFETLLYGLEF